MNHLSVEFERDDLMSPRSAAMLTVGRALPGQSGDKACADHMHGDVQSCGVERPL